MGRLAWAMDGIVAPWSDHPSVDRDRAEGEEMTKTPRAFEGLKPMTKAEREARRAFRQVDAEKAMTEHEIARKPGTSQGRAAGAGSCRDARRGQESHDQEEAPLKIHPLSRHCL